MDRNQSLASSHHPLPCTKPPGFTSSLNKSLSSCKNKLLEKLEILKAQQIISNSLKLNTNEFELLEFYGDSLLYERVSQNLMLTKRFMTPHLLTAFRQYIVQNVNLAAVFDTLGLAELLDVPAPPHVKSRADVVEAIIGELGELNYRDDSVELALTELISYVSYLGEVSYHMDMARAPQPTQAPVKPPSKLQAAATNTPVPVPTKISKNGAIKTTKATSPSKSATPMPPALKSGSAASVSVAAESSKRAAPTKKKSHQKQQSKQETPPTRPAHLIIKKAWSSSSPILPAPAPAPAPTPTLVVQKWGEVVVAGRLIRHYALATTV